MLEAMRELALEYFRNRLDGQTGETAEATYRRVREQNPETLFPFLVEASDEEDEKGPVRYYTLLADSEDSEMAVLEAQELKSGDGVKLPFNQGSGPNSPALGPVVKRTAKKGGDLESPKQVIQERTLNSFLALGSADRPWSPFFSKAHSCWSRPKLRSSSGVVTIVDPENWTAG